MAKGTSHCFIKCQVHCKGFKRAPCSLVVREQHEQLVPWLMCHVQEKLEDHAGHTVAVCKGVYAQCYRTHSKRGGVDNHACNVVHLRCQDT